MQVLYWKDYMDKIPNHLDFTDKMCELIINKILNENQGKDIIIDNFNYTYSDFCLFSLLVQCAQIAKRKLYIIVKKVKPYWIHKMKKFNKNFVVTKKITLVSNYNIYDSNTLYDYYEDSSFISGDPQRSPFLPHEIDTLITFGDYCYIPKKVRKEFERNKLYYQNFYNTYHDMNEKELI